MEVNHGGLLRKMSRKKGNEGYPSYRNEERASRHAGHLSGVRHKDVQNWESVIRKRETEDL